jgi:hypothetical protein
MNKGNNPGEISGCGATFTPHADEKMGGEAMHLIEV